MNLLIPGKNLAGAQSHTCGFVMGAELPSCHSGVDGPLAAADEVPIMRQSAFSPVIHDIRLGNRRRSANSRNMTLSSCNPWKPPVAAFHILKARRASSARLQSVRVFRLSMYQRPNTWQIGAASYLNITHVLSVETNTTTIQNRKLGSRS